jgi:hypothetical protein
MHYIKNEACRNLLARHNSKLRVEPSNNLLECMDARFTDACKREITCNNAYPSTSIAGQCVCGETTTPYTQTGGTTVLYRGCTMGCPINKQLGFAPTLFEEIIHSCGWAEEPVGRNRGPFSDAFLEIMKVCTGYNPG